MLKGMQLQLFEAGFPPRPTIFDERITDFLLDQTVQKISVHLGYSRSCQDHCRLELKDCIEFENDPKKIVLRLVEEYCWKMDSVLLEIIQGIPDLRRIHNNSLVKEWVLQNGIIAKYSVGDVVSFKFKDSECHGKIMGIDARTANYLVRHLDVSCDSPKVFVPFENTQLV